MSNKAMALIAIALLSLMYFIAKGSQGETIKRVAQ